MAHRISLEGLLHSFHRRALEAEVVFAGKIPRRHLHVSQPCKPLDKWSNSYWRERVPMQQIEPCHACVLSPHIVGDLAHEALERGAADEGLGRALVLADLPSQKLDVSEMLKTVTPNSRAHLSATTPGFVLLFSPFLSIFAALLESFFPAGRLMPCLRRVPMSHEGVGRVW